MNHYWKPTKMPPITDRPIFDISEYKGKETIEEWRAKMAEEKKAILNELL